MLASLYLLKFNHLGPLHDSPVYQSLSVNVTAP